MCEVTKAYALDKDKKQLALELYKRAAAEVVQSNYCPQSSCAFTDLSAVFGVLWLNARSNELSRFFNAALYAESNVAFNYANLTLGIRGRFIALTKGLVPKAGRVSNERLKIISRQLDQVLTATTESQVKAAMRAA